MSKKEYQIKYDGESDKNLLHFFKLEICLGCSVKILAAVDLINAGEISQICSCKDV